MSAGSVERFGGERTALRFYTSPDPESLDYAISIGCVCGMNAVIPTAVRFSWSDRVISESRARHCLVNESREAFEAFVAEHRDHDGCNYGQHFFFSYIELPDPPRCVWCGVEPERIDLSADPVHPAPIARERIDPGGA